ncbi:MAG: PilZ domain-containing protein [Acidobacteriia bacterium]|nr:PilZ domain-containing protein [Terriglobia bacterium]
MNLRFEPAAHPSPAPSGRRSRRPQLPSLVLSRDLTVIRAIRSVAQREEIPLDICGDSHAAAELVLTRPYQALLVDLDVAGAGHVLNSLRRQPDKPVTVALVASGTLLESAFGVGAVLAIHKPLASGSVRLGLKAAYSVADRQGRKNSRRPAHIPCRLGLPSSRAVPAAVLSLGEGGACVSAERCIVPGTFVTLRFVLPGTKPILDVGAVAVWNDGKRDTGLRFQRLHYRHAGRIRDWVQAPLDPSTVAIAAGASHHR